MPFKSEKQRRYCWYLYNKAKKEGKKPTWDCKKWSVETKNKHLPMYVTDRHIYNKKKS